MMIKRILENVKCLALILISDSAQKNNMLSDDEQEMIKDAEKVLEPFYEITKRLSNEKYVSCDAIIPAFLCLKRLTKDIDTASQEFADLFKQLVKMEVDFYCEKYNTFDKKH
jgi:hypothetical protein